ncbi:MAG: cytochrome c biogenesis protein CcsA [Melioribacteraceae bacterium]|nr:cytochrome c biogenesis protein CcsA [Melioribacteraceae bacterium]
MAGNILLTLALLTGIFSSVMYYYTYKGKSNTLQLARIGYHLMTVFIIAASALLLYAILTHQFHYQYIFSYSGEDLSTGLLMSTFFAGQEGSFLLWTLFSAIIGIILLDFSSKRGDLEPRVMAVFTLTIVFLLIMINPLLKSPFAYLWTNPTYVDLKFLNQNFLNIPALDSFIFTDTRSNATLLQVNSDLIGVLAANGIEAKDFFIHGKGLNPLLQNFWMQIHPPILFVGFAMSTVPFALAFAALLKNEYRTWIKHAFPWMLAGSMVLGLAIMLGGYWAYGVLGWGGYWGWDPVENSSLVPWLVSVAAIHTLIVQKKTQKEGGNGTFIKTNLLLAMFTYLFVLYSTFLTRSGILGEASVHSFVDPGMTAYLFLLSFILTFTILGFAAFSWRWKSLESITKNNESFLSRELSLFSAAVVILASALIILAGTSMPIFGKTVEISFYNEMNLPIVIIIGIFNGLSIYLKWRESESNSLIKSMIPALGLSVLLTAAIVFISSLYDFMLVLFLFSAVFALVVNLEFLIKIMRGRKLFTGGYISHIGMAIFFLGVIASGNFSKDKQMDLVKDVPTQAHGYELTFTGYTPIQNGTRFAFNVNIKNGSEEVGVISPVMFRSEFNNSMMREPDILNMLTSDFYISPIGFDDGSKAHAAEGQTETLKKGNSAEFEGRKILFEAFNFNRDAMSAMQTGAAFRIGAVLKIAYNSKTYQAEPVMELVNGEKSFSTVEIKEANLRINMTNLDAGGTIQIQLSNLDQPETDVHDHKEVFTIEASTKPFIGLVWLGVLVMVFGFTVSTIRRAKAQ